MDIFLLQGFVRVLKFFAVHYGLRLVHLQKFPVYVCKSGQFLHSLAVSPCALLPKNF